MSVLKSVFMSVAEFVLFVVTLVGYAPLAILFVWKSLVSFFARRKNLQPMEAADYLTLIGLDMDIFRNTKFMNGNLGVVCKLKGKVDGKEFFRNFMEKVVKICSPINYGDLHIRFHQSVEKYGGYWFLKTFESKLVYENHVSAVSLAPGVPYQDAVTEWLKIQYNHDSPLWGILLVYCEGTGETVFGFKIHHLLADGYSILHILDLLTNTSFKYQVRDFNDTTMKKIKILKEASWNIFVQNMKISLSPKSIFANKDEEDVFMTTVVLATSEIKAVRQKAVVRFASVMLYLVRNYLQDILLNLSPNGNEIPDSITLTNSLPWPNHPKNTLCNHATGAPFTFNIDKQPNIYRESLTDINNKFEDFHANHLDKAIYLLSKPIAVIPCSLFNLMNQAHLNPLDKVSAEYIHLIGSEEYENVFDTECSDMQMYCVPPRQKTISITCLTTSNEVRINIMGPKYVFPSQQMADDFSKSNFKRHLDELLANAPAGVTVVS